MQGSTGRGPQAASTHTFEVLYGRGRVPMISTTASPRKPSPHHPNRLLRPLPPPCRRNLPGILSEDHQRRMRAERQAVNTVCQVRGDGSVGGRGREEGCDRTPSLLACPAKICATYLRPITATRDESHPPSSPHLHLLLPAQCPGLSAPSPPLPLPPLSLPPSRLPPCMILPLLYAPPCPFSFTPSPPPSLYRAPLPISPSWP